MQNLLTLVACLLCQTDYEIFKAFAWRDNDKALQFVSEMSVAELESTSHVEGWTPIHHVAFHDNIFLLRALLNKGVSPNLQLEPDAFSPLHAAVAGNSAESLKLLIESGAKPDARTADGETALHRAAGTGLVESVFILLEHGADPDLRALNTGRNSIENLIFNERTGDLATTQDALRMLPLLVKYSDQYDSLADVSSEVSQKLKARLLELYRTLTRVP